MKNKKGLLGSIIGGVGFIISLGLLNGFKCSNWYYIGSFIS